MADIIKLLKDSKKNLFVGLAGPGTGKSTNFKTIIESSDYKGKKILILSFINKLVDDLKSDFKDFDNVRVSTLHSFAKQEVKRLTQKEIDFDQDLDQIISKDSSFIKGVDIDYVEKFSENDLTDVELEFYRDRQNFYSLGKEIHSFNSIVHFINNYFKEHEEEIPKYDLILIDEFQDFNQLEYELIKLLNKFSPAILVGDDEQSLYYFKKARPQQIRELYNDVNSEKFSFDFCYRCPKVIVNAVNDLIKNVKVKGFLSETIEKKFLYPDADLGHKEKHEISLKFPKIDFISSVSGDLLFYRLAKCIKEDIEEINNSKKRILLLVPSYFKQTIYDGMLSQGFIVVDFTLFSDEEKNNMNHDKLIAIFETLTKRKTDNYALRKGLPLYLSEEKLKEILIKNKKIFNCLDDDIKILIDKDIDIFSKVKKGKDHLTKDELERFEKKFNLKNILSKLIKGFKPILKNSIQVEMTTVTSSKGISADFVYYIGIDDFITMDRKSKKFTDNKICEFLVGITRAKQKLTLISFEDKNPKILEFINSSLINRI